MTIEAGQTRKITLKNGSVLVFVVVSPDAVDGDIRVLTLHRDGSFLLGPQTRQIQRDLVEESEVIA